MPDNQSPPDVNVRSSSYYVARTSVRCPHCGLSTRLLALALPPDHETLDPEAADEEIWQRSSVNALLFYVGHLPEDVGARLRPLSQDFRLAPSDATHNCYWANHCEHCGTLLGDHELHCEPDGAFVPSSATAAGNIRLLEIGDPFEATAAGYTFEPEFFRFMVRS